MRTRNKKAEMSIWGALLSFALVLILTPGVRYYHIQEEVNVIDQNLADTVQSVCTASNILNFDSVKFDKGFQMEMANKEDYITVILNEAGWNEEVGGEYMKDGYMITDPDIVLDQENRCFSFTYLLHVPIRILSQTVTTVTVEKNQVFYISPLYETIR